MSGEGEQIGAFEAGSNGALDRLADSLLFADDRNQLIGRFTR